MRPRRLVALGLLALLGAGCEWPTQPTDITITNENTNTNTADSSTGTENQAPRFSQTHYAFTLEAARAGPVVVGTVQATDPDRDAVTYALDGAGAFVLRDAQSGAITYVGPGVDPARVPVAYRLTVTATDPPGATAQAAVTVEIVTVDAPNAPPVVVAPIPDQTLPLGQAAVIELEPHVADPDGDPLTYQAIVSAPAIVTAEVTAGVLLLTPQAAGAAAVTIIARDAAARVTTTFTVTVTEGEG